MIEWLKGVKRVKFAVYLRASTNYLCIAFMYIYKLSRVLIWFINFFQVKASFPHIKFICEKLDTFVSQQIHNSNNTLEAKDVRSTNSHLTYIITYPYVYM